MICAAKPELADPIVRQHYEQMGLHRADPACWLDSGHLDRHRFRTDSDHPLVQCANTAADVLRQNPVASFFQKFTCEWCGARQTMAEAGKFFTTGECEECGRVTNIEEAGCNYIVVAQIAGDASAFAQLMDALEKAADDGPLS
jgi:hypothetical protein